MRRTTIWIRPVLAALLVACAGPQTTSPDLTRQLAASEASIQTARTLGAERQPQAALYLKLAREAVATADQLADRGQLEDARRALVRAQVDADLALALANEARLRAAARSARAEVQAQRARGAR